MARSQQPKSRGKGRPFQKGVSGNPKGRKPGVAYPSHVYGEIVTAKDWHAIIKRMLSGAKHGSVRCAEWLASIAPKQRETLVEHPIPIIDAESAVLVMNSQSRRGYAICGSSSFREITLVGRVRVGGKLELSIGSVLCYT
jgi:hypothetical protein